MGKGKSTTWHFELAGWDILWGEMRERMDELHDTIILCCYIRLPKWPVGSGQAHSSSLGPPRSSAARCCGVLWDAEPEAVGAFPTVCYCRYGPGPEGVVSRYGQRRAGVEQGCVSSETGRGWARVRTLATPR
jgi:hypothetical protein